MSVRCYGCARVRCKTCGGRGMVYRRPLLVLSHDPCPDCKDGWREARTCKDWPVTKESKAHPLLGIDPAVLCPKCKEEDV